MTINIAILITILLDWGATVRTVQMTLDETLVEQVDAAVKRLGTTRSAFVRAALRDALRALREQEMDRRHREGYERYPAQDGELKGWESEQVWVD